MRNEAQLMLDPEANHRALRRCHGCGAYARPFEGSNGTIMCERCVAKRREEEEREEGLYAIIPLR